MLTLIDHVMICVPELSAGIEAYRRIGFDIYPGGEHAGRGTHNAIAFHEEDYLELLSVRDRDEYLSGHPGGRDHPLRVGPEALRRGHARIPAAGALDLEQDGTRYRLSTGFAGTSTAECSDRSSR